MALVSMFQLWWNRRNCYLSVFKRNERKPALIANVLDDLRDFCSADKSCATYNAQGQYDTHASAIREGRREVYLRICEILSITDITLEKMKEMEEDDN